MSGVKGRSGGHNRISNKEKLVKGEKKSRLALNPPLRIGERIDKISGLGEIGTQIFERYEPMLFNNGTLDTTDSLAFFMLCKAWERWYLKLKEVEEKGDYETMYDKEGNSYKISAPWFKQEIELWKALKQCLAECGINIRDRGRIVKVAKGESVNPFEGIT